MINRASNAAHEVLAPLQGGALFAWHGADAFVGYFQGIGQLQQDNKQLKQQLLDLTWENNRLHEYVYENERLRKLLNFKQRNALRFTLLGARVISRSPSNWYSTLVVDRGAVDGVREDMVVVSAAGLVGRVNAVGPYKADILPILDREGAVGAMVSESSTQGVIEGNKEEPGVLRMIHLPYDASLNPGQVVVTSGLGGIFPRNIPIGEIEKFDSSSSKLDKYALVRPYVDFNRLEEVFIVTEVREVPEPVTNQDNPNQP